METSSSREPLFLLLFTALALSVSAAHPADTLTWALETFPVMIGAPILIATYRRFPLTPLVYRLLTLHALILIVGGHYTYAQVPLGFWLQEVFDFSRNHYDRIGHFAQGFVPAMLAREILLRRSPLKPGKWLFFIVTCICLAISAFYEFIEWWTALLEGSAADAFLGTQGDVWDTQWDMFLAFVGAMSSQLMFAGAHDRAMAKQVFLKRSD
ncbi:MAG: DUF2238 domain-containing protein [Pseudomonadota bacterium]